MQQRSSKAEIRNPVLALPAVKKLSQLPAPTRGLLADLLLEVSQEANVKAQQSWLKSKAPMAAYWKAVSIYAKHIAHAVRASAKSY